MFIIENDNTFFFFLQVESDGSRSGSSLSLRTVLPSSAGGTASTGAANNNNGTTTSHSPQHASSGRTTVTGNTGGGGGGASDGNHRGVQRSISASSSSKPRRGSTGAENNNAVICESQTTSQVATSPSQTQPKSQKLNQVVTHNTENEADALIQGGTEKKNQNQIEKDCVFFSFGFLIL